MPPEAAIGQQAGAINQGSQAIAVGKQAGYQNQGANAIAIGAYAGFSNQAAGSIVLNASGANVNATTSGFYVNPVRSVTSSSGLVSYSANEMIVTSNVIMNTVTATTFVGNGSQLTGVFTPMTISNVQITSNTWTVLDDTAVSVDGGYCLVNGSGFAPGSLVTIGTDFATATTYISANQLRVQAPAKSAGSYNASVIRGDTSTATLPLSITYSATPVWGTAVDLGTVTPSTAFSRTLAATSDSSVTYSNITALPPQTTLASNGTLTGNIVSGTTGTTYSFDVKATDTELQDALRTFLLLLRNWANAKLIPSYTEGSALFGSSVSMSGDGARVIVGAPYDNTTGGTDSGAAYVFFFNGATWIQESRLVPADSEANAYFGSSVSMSGDGTRVIVGAYADDATGGTDSGAAYVFSRSATTWTQESKLIPTDSEANAYFGSSVSMSGDGTRVIVGAYSDDATGAVNFNSGAAYVFSRSATTWTQESKLIPSDSEANAYFGFSVSMSGDGTRVIVGAYRDDATGGTDSGAAYVFSRSATTWTQESKLIPSDSEANALFGWSVSMSSDGTRVIVGAPYDDATGAVDFNSGAAYVFSRSATTWTQESKLIPTDSEANALFGYSVSMSSDGTRVIVGAPYDDVGFSDSGAAYVCEYNGSTWLIS